MQVNNSAGLPPSYNGPSPSAPPYDGPTVYPVITPPTAVPQYVPLSEAEVLLDRNAVKEIRKLVHPILHPEASKKQKMLIVAAKVTLVLIIVGALVAASISSFGAVPAIVNSGVQFAASVGALYGLSGGMMLAALATIPIALKNKMFKYTGNDLSNAGNFLMTQSIVTTVSMVVGTAIGAYFGPQIAQYFNPNLTLIPKGNRISFQFFDSFHVFDRIRAPADLLVPHNSNITAFNGSASHSTIFTNSRSALESILSYLNYAP